ncbi:hypothetical protein COUCH_22340 [Couchioplanes caeruleus]|uniref:hypothetical protein n=1 Tax=Couchioplanes caeruleus TaxID=56438 RepID=UPI0020BFEE15|nr:hypothetical protein [Couchioplanes caeruleus]UQU61780.1 hypothetical protein COUCH_22340 [Couchioplanes caeruleus]
MARISPTTAPNVRTHGPVDEAARTYAVEKLEAALHHAPAPVLRSWLTLDSAAYGDRVDAHVDVNGVPVHVHAVGSGLQEATDLMQQKLRSCLRRIRRRPDQGPAAPSLEEPAL